MSRSNYDKPFFVDVGTSIAAVRCQSNSDVLDRFDHVRMGKAGIEMAEKMCDRMNEEVEKFMAAKEGERNGILKANAQLAADNTRLRDELAAKDSMIAEQSAVNESQAAQLRDALNECEELKCAIADLKHISDAVVKSLRDKKLEMSGEIAAKDAEIEKLRALVKGLLDASSISCAECKYDCYSDHSNCIIHEAANYIKKAREVEK